MQKGSVSLLVAWPRVRSFLWCSSSLLSLHGKIGSGQYLSCLGGRVRSARFHVVLAVLRFTSSGNIGFKPKSRFA